MWKESVVAAQDRATLVAQGNKEEAMMAAGEVAQRVKDMPTVDDLVQQIVSEGETVLKEIPRKALA